MLHSICQQIWKMHQWPQDWISQFLFQSQRKGVYQGGAWRRQWQATPVFLPGKSHGQRSLVGFNPWGCKESYATEELHFHFSLFTLVHGRRKWQLTQCSCLENPTDSGARWAGVAQSQTRLNSLSSSSSKAVYCYPAYLTYTHAE